MTSRAFESQYDVPCLHGSVSKCSKLRLRCSKESGPRMAKDPAYAEAVPASQKKSADPLVARITCCRWPRLSAWRSDPVLEARM